jgi:16S rRNA (uracil1498-N3)-methyltransferase
MNVFYCEDVGVDAILEEQEAVHCVRVLRHQIGDTVHIIDGKGARYGGVVSQISGKKCIIHITEREVYEEARKTVHIAVAPAKSNERNDWMLEKLIEIGVTDISFIITQRSERVTIKEERIHKIVIATMKQCKRLWMPQVHTPISFSEFIKTYEGGEKYIAYCGDGEKISLHPTLRPAILLIGPEGDFTETEIEQAIGKGYRTASLSTGILRTETAALVGAVQLMPAV